MTKEDYEHYMDLAVKANEKMYRQMEHDAEARGEARGKTEGISEGKDAEKKSMTKKLYNAGVDMKVIKDTTGFNENQIKNICL